MGSELDYTEPSVPHNWEESLPTNIQLINVEALSRQLLVRVGPKHGGSPGHALALRSQSNAHNVTIQSA